jgi:hypothetical protein
MPSEPKPFQTDGAAPSAPGFRRDVVAGAVIVALSAFILWATYPLERGTLRLPGPGYFPQTAAALLGILGIAITATGWHWRSDTATTWNLRGVLFLCAGILLFAATIRTAGFLVAGPLCVIVSSFASSETRWKEVVVSSVLLTAFCLLTFKYFLGMPISMLTITSFW